MAAAKLRNSPENKVRISRAKIVTRYRRGGGSGRWACRIDPWWE
jgi:hypothetical protein